MKTKRLVLLVSIGMLSLVLFMLIINLTNPPAEIKRYVKFDNIKEYYGTSHIKIQGETNYENYHFIINDTEVKHSNVNNTFEINILVNPGTYNITMTNGTTVYGYKTIIVTELVCEQGQTKDCITTNQCDGKQTCKNNEWATCKTNPIICKPNTRTGCSLNSCEFGMKTCNQCGTSYSSCQPV